TAISRPSKPTCSGDFVPAFNAEGQSECAQRGWMAKSGRFPWIEDPSFRSEQQRVVDYLAGAFQEQGHRLAPLRIAWLYGWVGAECARSGPASPSCNARVQTLRTL